MDISALRADEGQTRRPAQGSARRPAAAARAWRGAAALAMCAGLAGAAPAWAQAVKTPFFGDFQRFSSGAQPSGRCWPTAFTVTVRSDLPGGFNNSNLGSFTSFMNQCVQPPPPTAAFDGQWSFDFGGGDTLFGITGSVVTSAGAPGVFTATAAFLVSGGTGRFAGAQGTLIDTMVVDFNGGPADGTGSFNGFLYLQPIPEPAAWALMLGGLAAIGAVARRRRG
jgi:hypothetical protein